MLKATVTFKNKTPETSQSIVKAVNQAVQKGLLVMERNIKINTPIRHGTLARSIQRKMINIFEGEVFSGAVQGGKEVDYAVHVEYGTRFMAPRAMFRKGVADSEDRINKIFEEELSSVVK